MIVYADILFAINFSMDFLSLYICSMIIKGKTSRLRIIISALVGALYGVIDVVFRPNRAFSLILCVIFTFFMCLIAFYGMKFRRLLASTVLLLGIGAMLGGIMSIIYSLLNKVFSDVISSFEPSVSYNGARFFLIASVSAVVAIIFSRFFLKEKEKKTVNLTVIYDGCELKTEALVDSGSCLRDPLSQKQVILISKLNKLAKRIESVDDRFKRFVPYKDVSGRGILKGIVPQKIYLNGNLVDGVVCVSESSDFFGFDALVPYGLL